MLPQSVLRQNLRQNLSGKSTLQFGPARIHVQRMVSGQVDAKRTRSSRSSLSADTAAPSLSTTDDTAASPQRTHAITLDAGWTASCKPELKSGLRQTQCRIYLNVRPCLPSPIVHLRVVLPLPHTGTEGWPCSKGPTPISKLSDLSCPLTTE